MPLDGISARFLTAELNRRLAGARIDKVFQSERTDVVLSLRNEGTNFRLILSAHPDSPRLHLTRYTPENPAYPPMFCMLLRKHLIGARLLDVTSEGWERVFTFRFQSTDELGDSSMKKLVVEIMGRHSNIILVTDGGTIMDAAVHVDDTMSRVREVLPAHRYLLPPKQDKQEPEEMLRQITESPAGWLRASSTARNVELAILDCLQGVSPPLCREICHIAGIDGKRPPDTLTERERVLLGSSIKELVERVLAGDVRPSVYRLAKDDPSLSDFHALALTASGYREDRPSLSEAMDEYYEARTRRNRLEQRRRKLSQTVSARLTRVLRKSDAHRSDIQTCDGYLTFRRQGELILANMHSLENGIPGFHAMDYSTECPATVWIPLESNRTLSQNAQRLFRQYSKAKARLAAASRFLAQDLEQVEYLRTLTTAIDNADDDTDLTAVNAEWDDFCRAEGDAAGENGRPHDQKSRPAPKKTRSKKPVKPEKKKQAVPASEPRAFLSSDGFTILVGRSNIQNDRLTFKTADRDDLWLHVQKEPGTHVIVRAGHRQVPDRTLLEAAETAAWFSRPGGSGALRGVEGKAPALSIDYCPVSHVRKISGAKPGMVIYENYRTLQARPTDPVRITRARPDAPD